MTELWAVDAAIAEDILIVFAQLLRCRRYPDSLGCGEQFDIIVHRWRSSPSHTR